MTKQDLVNAQRKLQASQKTTSEIFEAILSSITKSLKKGENVTVTGSAHTAFQNVRLAWV